MSGVSPHDPLGAPPGALDLADPTQDDGPYGLPPLRRQGRHPLIMLVILFLSAAMLYLYREDALYFTRPRAPLELGSTVSFKERFERERDFDPGFPHNGYVRISGLTGLKSTANAGEWAFFKLAYVPVYVQVGPQLAGQLHGDETVFVTIDGRLRRMAKTTRYDRLQQLYRERFGVSFANAYILEAGKQPADCWWAALLFLLFSSFIGINLILLVRWLRRP